METLTLSPIGQLKSSEILKFGVPHQPDNQSQKKHLIELLPGYNFEAALRDLEGFDRIWLIWWFHKNSSWRPCVMPPRGEPKRRGLFATRSPHRPNPIGISCVRLLKISGRRLYVSDTDLIDGTPILDIKPYIPEVDSFPDSSYGWLQEVREKYVGPGNFQVILSPLAQEQINWLKSDWDIDFYTYAENLLKIDPSPHRTRRIIKLEDNLFRMGCGAWRLFFRLSKDLIEVLKIAPGYPLRALNDPKMDRIKDKEAQILFNTKWPGIE